MKSIRWMALACAVGVMAGCPQDKLADPQAVVAPEAPLAKSDATAWQSSLGTAGVTLTLDTPPVTAQVTSGDPYLVLLGGTWQNAGTGAVYLQASDSAGTFVAPAPALAPKFSIYRIALPLPTTTPVGLYTGTLSVRACADSLCTQPYADSTHSIGYTLEVKASALGEWETLQRTSRHDGYVPVEIDAARYRAAWTYQRPTDGSLSPVVTHGDKVFFSEPGSAPSVYGLRAADGVAQWRRVFSGSSGFGPALTPPTVSNGVVYVSTTGHQDTWLYALRASDGLLSYQSQFATQWANILNPTVRNGKVFVNSGYYGGVVYAFNLADGVASWNASGGTYGMNTPAADDDYVYAHNGSTLNVFNATDGSLFRSIGPNPTGMQVDYYGTPMLGADDHVLAYSGTSYNAVAQRQLLDYSVANQATRWMSIALYSNYPAVAKGVVYATSNETRSLDALDEATGRLLWSWKPSEQSANFIGNVVVTDNVAFVSTSTRIYAIDLLGRRHSVVWSAPTPGAISIGSNRMLYVSTPADTSMAPRGRITAYRLD